VQILKSFLIYSRLAFHAYLVELHLLKNSHCSFEHKPKANCDTQSQPLLLDKIQIDTAYHIHNTDSKTTLGCIRCTESERLAKLIESALKDDVPVFLEVL